MIPSVEWANEYRLKRIRFIHLYNDFLKTKVLELTNKLIVDPIIDEMKREGVSEKIYQTVQALKPTITKDGIRIRIHSEYFADNGFDVALAREKGTDQDTGGKHWVRPKNKMMLKWVENGKARFSAGHKVSGLPRLNIIQKMVERNQYELQDKLNTAYMQWKSQIFNE